MHIRLQTLGINTLLCAVSILVSLEIGLRILTAHSDTLHNILWLPTDYGKAQSIEELMDLAPIKLHMRRWAGINITEKGFRTPPYAQKKAAGALRTAAKTGAVYSNRNTHWNAEGNRIASQQITAQLLPLLAEQKLSQ